MAAAARSFDPESAGAQHLARTWLPLLELWQVKMLCGPLIQPDGRVVHEGDVVEVPSHHGQQLVEDGSAGLLDRRLTSAHE